MGNLERIELVLALYCTISFVTTIMTFAISTHNSKDGTAFDMMPWNLYKNSEHLNIFGAIMCSLLLLCVMPVYWVINFIIWLFTVGRKEK